MGKAVVEVGVVHGRFQVLHNDHLRYLLAGRDRCRHLVVGVTNPDPALTRDDPADPARSSPRANPLTYFERHRMVKEVLLEAGLDYRDFSVVPVPINFPHLLTHYVPSSATHFLTIYDQWGERKLADLKALGLRTEVLWRRRPEEKGLTGTDIRRLILEGRPYQHLVPPAVARMIKELDLPLRLARLESTVSCPRP